MNESVFKIRGRVQGVGFRLLVEEWALREGLGGWVRNERDGSVSLCLRGEGAAIEKLMGRLRALRGPRPPQVDAADLQSEQELGAPAGLGGFSILD